ncbi:hypothetical protein BpHYR1_036698 [Brachionus plicatilis]|uniref:Uncharacterized protein n=1 Tax=Brachionus plicatilis TaxID=10195 RepID=A0A3M7QUJ7_BRAPC|nr:hypothetical protein BpHYR1_036698 [Brachionus plicatilis]
MFLCKAKDYLRKINSIPKKLEFIKNSIFVFLININISIWSLNLIDKRSDQDKNFLQMRIFNLFIKLIKCFSKMCQNFAEKFQS